MQPEPPSGGGGAQGRGDPGRRRGAGAADREQLAALLGRVTDRLQSAEAQIAEHDDDGGHEANPAEGELREAAGVLR